jgi:fluoride exporter
LEKYNLQNYIFVFLGAGLGGIMRYWGSAFVYKILPPDFPYGTLAVNVLGSFLIGIFIYYFDYNKMISTQIRIMLTVGVCGGLTTFSTFSFETINYLREGEVLFAGLNIIFNVVLTLLALFAAYKISNLLTGV